MQSDKKKSTVWNMGRSDCLNGCPYDRRQYPPAYRAGWRQGSEENKLSRKRLNEIYKLHDKRYKKQPTDINLKFAVDAQKRLARFDAFILNRNSQLQDYGVGFNFFQKLRAKRRKRLAAGIHP